MYDKDKLVVGECIQRKIRTDNGEKMLDLEVLPYVEKEKKDLALEFSALGFRQLYALHTHTQAFGNSVLMIFQKD